MKIHKVIIIVLLIPLGWGLADSTVMPELMNSSEIELALQKLEVLGSALYIAAHPDDENTALLAYLSKERLLRSGYLALTRGDGGQNLIGTESSELLGILRTQELLAARRIDGAEQFFTRAIDFGYSKTPEETLEIWDKNKILYDMVWIIRQFRPDILITRFTPKMGGHGHHRASAILAIEAFHAAGDANKFPDQLQHLEVWQPKRIVWNAWRPAIENQKVDRDKFVKVDLGAFNRLLGKSYGEISAKSRSMHKSQGFGASPRRGTYPEYFVHLAGDSARNDLLDGINLDWEKIADGKIIRSLIRKAQSEWQSDNPAASVPILLKIYNKLTEAPQSDWKKVKAEETKNIIQSCLGLWLEAGSGDYFVSPGDSLRITLQALNRSDQAVTLKKIRIPFCQKDTTISHSLDNNGPYEVNTTLPLPLDAPVSQPYWLTLPPTLGTFTISGNENIGKPESPPLLLVDFHLHINNTPIIFQVPVVYSWTDPTQGERQRHILISPRVTVTPSENLYLFSKRSPKEIDLTINNINLQGSGNIEWQLPDEWEVTPSTHGYKFADREDVVRSQFRITPPEHPASAEVFITGSQNRSQKYYQQSTIDYSHIPLQVYFYPAAVKLVKLDIEVPQLRVGYIMGSGDDIPQVLSQLGIQVVLLTEDNFVENEITHLDAIITGIRAYNTQKWLSNIQPLLLDYIKRGGTLLVQYTVSRNMIFEELGPYPFKISRDRVSVETAPVQFLDESHPLLNVPNKITPGDFNGWIQERGLYFSDEWNPAYETPIGSADPGEELRTGGLLYTKYGEGIFIYTGYSFFRQLPAGVPGAIKLYVNLISAKDRYESEKK